MGQFKCFVRQMGWGCNIFRGKRYEGVMFNVISGTRGWVGVQCLNGPYVYDVKGMLLNVLFGVLVFGCMILLFCSCFTIWLYICVGDAASKRDVFRQPQQSV